MKTNPSEDFSHRFRQHVAGLLGSKSRSRAWVTLETSRKQVRALSLIALRSSLRPFPGALALQARTPGHAPRQSRFLAHPGGVLLVKDLFSRFVANLCSRTRPQHVGGGLWTLLSPSPRRVHFTASACALTHRLGCSRPSATRA